MGEHDSTRPRVEHHADARTVDLPHDGEASTCPPDNLHGAALGHRTARQELREMIAGLGVPGAGEEQKLAAVG